MNKMVKFMGIVIVILLVALAMILTNPDKESFVNWAAKEIEQNSTSALEEFLGGIIAKPVLYMATTRQDYRFFSIYSIEKQGKESQFMGIFNTFFKLRNIEIN